MDRVDKLNTDIEKPFNKAEFLRTHWTLTVAHHLLLGNQCPQKLEDLLAELGYKALISVGESVKTCVTDLRLFPGFTFGGDFGKRLNLIGYHANSEREYGTSYLFLVAKSESL